MTDDYQTGICTANWWNTARSHSDIGSFGLKNDIDMKAIRSYQDSSSISCNSVVYQDTQRLQESDSIYGGTETWIDSTLRSVGYNASSATEWNQALLSGTSGRSSELNLSSMPQDDLCPRSSFQPESVLDDWSPKSSCDGGEDPSTNPLKHINQVFFLEQHGLASRKISGDYKVNYPIVSASTLLPGLFEPDTQSQPSPYFMMNYSYPKQQSNMNNNLHLSNINIPFWNASTEVRSSIPLSPQTEFLTSTFNRNCSNLAGKLNDGEVRDTSSVMKKSSELTFKRPRIETPSPLPTFKVRKEKLGDRVTALQQLVSPFGKTDTASVLYEAIEYIKFLHDQVGVLSTPYMNNGASIQYTKNSSKDIEGLEQDLKSRGLCLVPISSTFPVTNETTSDFWTPTFGGTYR